MKTLFCLKGAVVDLKVRNIVLITSANEKMFLSSFKFFGCFFFLENKPRIPVYADGIAINSTKITQR